MIEQRLPVNLFVASWLAASVCAQTHEPMRGVLTSPGGDLPFVMSAIGQPYCIYHGAHEVPLAITRDGPKLVLDFPPYDSRIEARSVRPDVGADAGLTGTWRKVGPAGEVTMPFRWEVWPLEVDKQDPGRRLFGPLFPLAGEPLDVNGRWLVQFGKDAHPAVAIFEPSRGPWVQVPGEIQGTFLTVTGDYRYLAGTARGDELRLSCFDGAHAFLFVAKRQQDGTLAGDFWSGTNWHETWTARRDDKAALPDAFTLTKARAGRKLADLKFPDATDGKAPERRLGDLLGKATLVVLFGTWCPNCFDAGALLEDLEQRHRDRGLRVVGLAFEHGDDRDRQRRAVASYRTRCQATWPILLAGSSDKAKASEAFPVLDAVRAFPTIVFVDAEGTVRAVHQGFAGPATGDAHAAQNAAIDKLVVRLLAEAHAGR